MSMNLMSFKYRNRHRFSTSRIVARSLASRYDRITQIISAGKVFDIDKSWERESAEKLCRKRLLDSVLGY